MRLGALVGPQFAVVDAALQTAPEAGQFGWQATPYALVAFAAAVVAVGFAAVMWRSERGPGTRSLMALALGAAWWAALYGLELASVTLGAKLLFGRLSYLGIVVVPVSWLTFALAYTGYGDRLTARTVGLLGAPAALAALLPWTSGRNDLFWAATALVSLDSGSLLAIEYGPGFWLWSAYAYLLLAGGTLVLLWSVPANGRLFRRQTALLLVGVATPWVANTAYLLRVFGPGTLDLTPLGFVVSAVALGGGLRRYRLLDVHPAVRAFARDELVERMDEPVVVLTPEGRVVDLNRSARAVLDVDADAVVGTPFDAAAPDLAAAVDETDGDAAEFTTGTPPRHYEVHASLIEGDQSGVIGQLVTLTDVTERRRRERQVAVLNRVLRHDLRNDIAAIRASASLLQDDPNDERFLAIIDEKADEMGQLLRTVREVEQSLAAGGPTLIEVDIASVVDERVAAARRAYPDATVEIATLDAQPIRSTDLVSSVVDNLVENAVEHNDTDAPHVRVSVERVTADGQPWVEVRVADDGPGIPPNDRAVLTGEQGLEKASGLGLWLVNWLVTESGGEVRYEANDPRGSIVVVRFPPAAAMQEDDRRPTPEHDPTPNPTRAPGRTTSSTGATSPE